MAVEEIEAVEAVARQRLHHVAHDGDQGRGPQGHGAGEGHVMLGHADRNRRRDQRLHRLAQAAANDLGGQGVGADQAVGPVLLGGADRHDDSGAGLEVFLDLGPGAKLQQHLSPLTNCRL